MKNSSESPVLSVGGERTERSKRSEPSPPIVFAHANSFGASTYRVMFDELRARGFRVSAIERLGHNPDYPVSNNWPHLVEELHAHIAAQQQGKEKCVLVGHSMGGFLSAMCAALHPQRVKAVVLLDAPLLGGWRATTVGFAKQTQLVGSISPGRVSRARRQHWPDKAAALAHFEHKRAFAGWHPAVLHDYIEHGMEHRPDGCWLAFDREVETQIYNTLPNHLAQLFKRHPLRCPVSFIGGLRSAEVRQVGMTLTQQITQGRIQWLEGSHLFPMERPRATAAAIEAAICSMLGH